MEYRAHFGKFEIAIQIRNPNVEPKNNPCRVQGQFCVKSVTEYIGDMDFRVKKEMEKNQKKEIEKLQQRVVEKDQETLMLENSYNELRRDATLQQVFSDKK